MYKRRRRGRIVSTTRSNSSYYYSLNTPKNVLQTRYRFRHPCCVRPSHCSLLLPLPIVLIQCYSATATDLPASQCNTGPVQCCDDDGLISDPTIASALGPLAVLLSGVTAVIGVTCTPITVVGVGSGATCDAHPLCCEDNHFTGIGVGK